MSAESVVDVSISSDKIILDDVANVVVSLSNCENITGMNMTLVYDQSIVSLESTDNITLNNSVLTGHSVTASVLESGKVSINVTGLDSITTAKTPIIDLEMLGVASGTTDMELTYIEYFTTDSSIPTDTISNGQIIVNSAPELAEIGDRVINETETLNFSLSAADADNDPLTYSKNVSFGNITGNEFTWTPDSGDNGTYAVSFTVYDGYEEDTENITITVNVKPVTNNPPVFDTIDDINTTVGSLVNFTVSANDADNDDLAYYNNSVLPEDSVFYPDNQSFAWTPTSNGTYTVNFGVDDGNGGSDSLDVKITVDDVVETNNPPVLAPIGDYTVNESELLEITLNATDIEGDSLTYSKNVSFGNITGYVFSWTPDYNSSGTYAVEFNVSDGNTSDSEIVNITVNDVVVVTNSAPVFIPIEDSNVNESELLVITLNATDVDGDSLTYSKNVSFGNITGYVFSWTPNSSEIGTHYVNFSVTDGELWDHYVANITVNEVASSVYTPEDPFNFVSNTGNFWVLHDWEAGNGNVTDGYNVSYNGTWYNTTVSEFNDSVRLNAHDWSNITAYAYNATSSVLSSGIESKVQIPNNPIQITDVASSYSISEGDTLAIDANYTDLDGDSATFDSNDTYIFNIDETSGIASWSTKHKDVGTHYVNLTVTDGYGSEDYQLVEITVSTVNSAPELAAIDSQSVNESETLSFTLYATDDDNETLTYSANGLPSGATLDVSTGEFSWTPGYDDNGSHYVEFIVTDSNNANDTEGVTITVNNVNRIPSIESIDEQSVYEDHELTFTLVGSDDDSDDTLTYSMNGLPPEATLNETTGEFSWTPEYTTTTEYRTFNANFMVSDGEDSVSQYVIITVYNTNRAPEFPEFTNISASEGTELVLNISAVDPDGDSLEYTKDVNFGIINDTNFEWTPDYNDSGIHYVEFNVSDGSLSNTTVVTIDVADVNRAPILNYIPTVSVNETELVTIILNATDPDGDYPLYYSMDSSLGNLSDNVFTWIPDYSYQGTTNYINFTVNDSSLSDTRMAVIGVNDTNNAPVFNYVGQQNINESEYLSFTVNATDPDINDELTYYVSGNPSTAVISSNSEGMTFTWTPDYTESGTYDVRFIVEDEKHYSDTMDIRIVVSNVNRAPTFDSLLPNYTINESDILEITLGSNDLDKDDSISVWVNDTGNASGTLSDDVYTWNTDYHDNGTYNIEFIVSDGIIITSGTTTVFINDVNAPPELSSIGSKSVEEKEELTFNITATDVDEDILTYSAQNLPANATLDSSTGEFSWTPIDGEAGTYSVIFYVNDSIDSDYETVSITVTETSSSSSSTTSSSGGGGGGGGGALTSGEEFDNIDFKDYTLKSVIKDVETIFAFYEENNSIVSLSFTSELNGGQVKAVIEVLKDTSSQVESVAPGVVYQNMNIYVDSNLGDDVIGDRVINFKVDKAWVEENNIDVSFITLCRYNSGEWDTLSTEATEEDEEYYYFTSKTPGFSPFAISSVDPSAITEEASAEKIAETSVDIEQLKSTEDDDGVPLESVADLQQKESSSFPYLLIIGLIGLVAIGLVGYRNRDYYDKLRTQLGNPDGKRYRRIKK
ncbi:Ig-like domain-containing protein [Methanolobus bombayensis]|uniref:Ig-like domain-containing protein n=1 Tax=Methanolobus bombayensis TaxID=38023 RepID=UPI001AE7EACE